MDDESDDDLWGHITREVKPIKREPKSLKIPQSTKKRDVQPEDEGAVASTRPVIVVRPEVQKTNEDAGQGLDRRSGERLRKGQMPIEGRLDLHGKNQEQAYEALRGFIQQGHAEGKRCVLVITGKGNDAQGRRDPLSQGQGVLKRVVPEWLAQAPLKALILKTAAARPQHGGDGAMYVLLRRKRQETGSR